jgi:hypothetical protein
MDRLVKMDVRKCESIFRDHLQRIQKVYTTKYSSDCVINM